MSTTVKTTISTKNQQALIKDGCATESSWNGAGTTVELSTRNLMNLPNRQILLFVADAKVCDGNTGRLKNVNFPEDFIVPDQYSKLKYDLKAELDKFDVGNDKVALDYITGYAETLEFEAAFMNMGVWGEFMEEKFLKKPIGAEANMVTLMLYGVTNPQYNSTTKQITGDKIKGILKVGPAEADSLIATGDEKKMSVTKITQHSTGSARLVEWDNTNGQYDNLISSMFNIKSIFEGVWDNNNAKKLLK